MEGVEEQGNIDLEKVGKTNAYKSLEQCILAYCHGGKHNFFFVYSNV